MQYQKLKYTEHSFKMVKKKIHWIISEDVDKQNTIQHSFMKKTKKAGTRDYLEQIKITWVKSKYKAKVNEETLETFLLKCETEQYFYLTLY